MTKEYLTVEGVESIKFTCAECGGTEKVVPKAQFDYINDMICMKCCRKEHSGC